MITVINESKTLIKHISCKCEHKFDSRKCNSNRRWNNEKCEYKTYQTYKKDHSQNPSPCICENGTYLKRVADYSKIACGENINVTVSTNFYSKKVRYKMDCYILHTVLLVIVYNFL